MTGTKITEISIGTHRIKQSIEFYTDVFDMVQLPPPDGDGSEQSLLGDNWQIRLFERAATETHTTQNLTLSVDNFAEIWRRVREYARGDSAAVSYGVSELPDGTIELVVRDPGGNQLTIECADPSGLSQSDRQELRSHGSSGERSEDVRRALSIPSETAGPILADGGSNNSSSEPTPEERLEELGIELPNPPEAVAAYEPWVRTGDQIVTSGQLPWDDDEMAFVGKLGTDLTEEEGYEAARLAAINAIAQLKDAVGELSSISQIIRLEGDVHAGPDFRSHPEVLDGASDLLNEVFGDASGHTRTALGTNEMPLDAAVHLSLWAEVEQ